MDSLNEHLKMLLVLEAIRSTGNSVPYPFDEEWDTLGDYIKMLIEQELLSIDSGTCSITDLGKRTILLFNSDRKDLLERLAEYKELVVGEQKIDARIPIEAFRVRKQDNAEANEYLFTLAVLIIWDEFFAMLKEIYKNSKHWQRSLFDSFYFNAKKSARRDAWKALGRTEHEALIVGTKFTNPIIKKDLVQITKQ